MTIDYELEVITKSDENFLAELEIEIPHIDIFEFDNFEFVKILDIEDKEVEENHEIITAVEKHIKENQQELYQMAVDLGAWD